MIEHVEQLQRLLANGFRSPADLIGDANELCALVDLIQAHVDAAGLDLEQTKLRQFKELVLRKYRDQQPISAAALLDARTEADSVCNRIKNWLKSNDGAGDESAYRPAEEFLTEADGQFPDYNSITRFLRKHPEIRTKRPMGKNGKPIPNRKMLHAADMLKYGKAAASNPLDAPASLVDAAREVESRKAAIRKQC